LNHPELNNKTFTTNTRITGEIIKMERTLIKDLNQHIDEQVTIQGWLHTLRDQKNMQFLIIRDRTGLVQVAHYKKGNLELAEQISTLGTESALTLSGKVVKNEIVKLGGLEIQLESLQVEGAADVPLPFEPFGEDNLPDQDFRLDWRYLDLRREINQMIFEVQSTAEQGMREFWLKNDFIEIGFLIYDSNEAESKVITCISLFNDFTFETASFFNKYLI